MAIITISRGSFFRGREIARKVAKELHHNCISREDLFKDAKEYNVPEIDLVHAFEDGPSILDRFTHGREKYIAYIQAALLRNLRKGNVVYHGFAFHFFVKNLPRVLKVRIIAELEDRIKFVMERDKISRKKAFSFIRKVDTQRERWSRKLYGIDPSDASLYDVVLHIGRITAEDAVDTICHIIGFKQFQPTSESERMIRNLALAAEVKAAMMDLAPTIEVSSRDGIVTVKTDTPLSNDTELTKKMIRVCEAVRGVKGTNILVGSLSQSSSPHRPGRAGKSTQEIVRTYFGEFG